MSRPTERLSFHPPLLNNKSARLGITHDLLVLVLCLRGEGPELGRSLSMGLISWPARPASRIAGGKLEEHMESISQRLTETLVATEGTYFVLQTRSSNLHAS
jgi:hypothetical protein